MNLIILVPNVVRRYIASFPEVTNNAYHYFNYDNRVVEERVNRSDVKSVYQGPDEFSDADYDGLVAFAQQKVDPILAKYSMSVACNDAMEVAIRSFYNGKFDGKVNASRFNVLLGALKSKFGLSQSDTENYRHAKKEETTTKKKDVEVKRPILKQLGIREKDIPHIHHLKRRIQKGLPYLVKEKGKIKVKKD